VGKTDNKRREREKDRECEEGREFKIDRECDNGKG